MGRRLGQRIFVAVVDEQGCQRSTTWQFKVSGSEVYGGQLDMHHYKLSLHSGGLCMWAFDTPYWMAVAKHERPGRSSRVIERWERPEPVGDDFVHAFSLGFPGSVLSQPKNLGEFPEGRLLKLPLPKPGEISEIAVHFSLVAPDRAATWASETYSFAAAPLKNGEYVYFLPKIAPFDDDIIRRLLNAPKSIEWRNPALDEDTLTEASATFHLGNPTGTCGRVIEIGGLSVTKE